MSLTKILRQGWQVPGGKITPQTFKDCFGMEQCDLVWRAHPTGKGNVRKGMFAGQPIYLRRGSREHCAGIRVFFLGCPMKAEDIVWTITHNAFPDGKVIHRDGDRLNNSPENLLLIPKRNRK